MKFSIHINQAGVVDAGLHTKTDMVDWALLDYIFGWQQNKKAKTLNGKVWLNYSHILTEMPLLGLNTKSSISNRIKKLRELNLIETNQSPVDQRLYVKTSESYFAITQFSAARTIPQNNQTVNSQEHPVPEKVHSLVNQETKPEIKSNSFSSYPAGAEKTETVLTLTPEQQEVFDWAATHTSKNGFSWCTATTSIETFLHVLNFPNGKLKAQFDAHKKARSLSTGNGLNSEINVKTTGGNYETRGKFNQPSGLSKYDAAFAAREQMRREWHAKNSVVDIN